MLDMANKGREVGLDYMCITEHADFDYLFMPEYSDVRQIDLTAYLDRIEAVKKDYPFLHVGIELGFSKYAESLYQKLPFDRFDYVLDSTHTIGLYDAYNKKFFIDKPKHLAYKQYLDSVRASVEAQYPYNTVSHIGYVRKNAPYENTDLTYEEFPEEIDGILKRIIERNKSLEINSKLSGDRFMPERDILARYYQLGGRLITFGSDSHSPETVANKYDLAVSILRLIGFDHWTVFEKMQPKEMPF